MRTLVRREMVAAVEGCDALLSAVSPTAAYKFGEKLSDPLSMYKGDLMTVGLNLSGAPSLLARHRPTPTILKCNETTLDLTSPCRPSSQVVDHKHSDQPCMPSKLTPVERSWMCFQAIRRSVQIVAGLPAIAMPFTIDTSANELGLPMGVQLVGQAFGEAKLLEIAHIFEQTVQFAEKHQPPQHA